MGVTRWLLIGLVIIYVPLSVFAIFTTASELYEIVRLDGHNLSGTYLQLYALFFEWAHFVIPTVLAYLALRDLKAIPTEVVERFRFKSLGFIGWIGLLIISAGFVSIFTAISIYSSVVGNINVTGEFWIEKLLMSIEEAVELIWLGALCLYARYRIAANKRLGAM